MYKWVRVSVACAAGLLSPCFAAQPVGQPVNEGPAKAPDSQPAPERFTVLPKFRQGEKAEYDLMLGLAGRYAKHGPTTIPVTITVLEAKEQEVLVEWRYGRLKLPKPMEGRESELPESFRVAFEFVPQIRLDLETRRSSLHNVEEARAWYKRYTDIEIQNLVNRGAKPNDVDGMRRAYAAIGENPRLLETTLLKSPGLWLSTLWQEGTVGKTEQFDVELPSLTGEGTMKMTRRVNVAREDSVMRIRVTTEPWAEELGKLMRTLITRSKGEPLPADFEKDMLEKDFRFVIENDCTVDPTTGWPETIVQTTEYSYEGGGEKQEQRLVRRHEKPAEP